MRNSRERFVLAIRNRVEDAAPMIPGHKCKFGSLRLLVFVIGMLCLHTLPMSGQATPERFWLAGRYDGNRVVVYFDAVKFEGTTAPVSTKIATPVAAAFFAPVELPASYIARFQELPNAEHFAIGDRYDLILGNGVIATIKLTTLVGCETDEQVGNDSFIGALGTVENGDALKFAKEYYAVRRHQESGTAAVTTSTKAENLKYANLTGEPVRYDVETQIAELLNQRMKAEATEAERLAAANISPAFQVQPFQLADGSLRYYARAEWKSGREPKNTPSYVLAAWITPLPTFRILAVEKRTSPYDGIESGLPDLRNVVDLGAGRTGMIFGISGLDSTDLRLVEYRDGASALKMKLLQSISTAE
ncbi:MAG TPA: hypothetical protein VKT71_06580 [Candidatus Acidoferrales bacterium]|nr:hypothetical protein [Candidatus Acidoferrales bacterium]